ncbi:coenzyme PQQ synthesis protein F [Klebsiella pneumoniae]|uniref:Coenzyme PQQ synthesis protein F n=1 Tax=Klebsiella pneumoniae TaxID=573 RepID=A0A2X3DUF8_KLEPN|nr:coenzyme PQQ synthesis protein F [Klebsiella pneumoniae]
MTLATRTVTLPGGLQATLVHQPQADRAAALARVAAGSHHEPSRFPWAGAPAGTPAVFTAESATRMMTD